MHHWILSRVLNIQNKLYKYIFRWIYLYIHLAVIYLYMYTYSSYIYSYIAVYTYIYIVIFFSNYSKLGSPHLQIHSKNVSVLTSLDPSLIFIFKLLPSPVHPNGFPSVSSLASLSYLSWSHRTSTTPPSTLTFQTNYKFFFQVIYSVYVSVDSQHIFFLKK